MHSPTVSPASPSADDAELAPLWCVDDLHDADLDLLLADRLAESAVALRAAAAAARRSMATAPISRPARR